MWNTAAVPYLGSSNCWTSVMLFGDVPCDILLLCLTMALELSAAIWKPTCSPNDFAPCFFFFFSFSYHDLPSTPTPLPPYLAHQDCWPWWCFSRHPEALLFRKSKRTRKLSSLSANGGSSSDLGPCLHHCVHFLSPPQTVPAASLSPPSRCPINTPKITTQRLQTSGPHLRGDEDAGAAGPEATSPMTCYRSGIAKTDPWTEQPH